MHGPPTDAKESRGTVLRWSRDDYDSEYHILYNKFCKRACATR